MGVFIILYMVLIPLVSQQKEQAPAPAVVTSDEDLRKKNEELAFALQGGKTTLVELQSALAATKESLDRLEVESKQKQDEAEAQIASLKNQLKNVQSQRDNMKAQLAQQNKVLNVDIQQDRGEGGNSEKVKNLYIQVKLEWTTNSHDVDLIIVDPKLNEFSSTTLGFDNVPGRHFGNTKGGPGFEVWQSYEGYAGTYSVYAVLKDYNRNKEDAQVEGNVELNRGNIKIRQHSISRTDTRVLVLQFTVDTDGQYKVTQE